MYFLGASEVVNESIYSSDNACVSEYDDTNIVIVEKDYLLPVIENDMYIIFDPTFYKSTWKKVFNQSKNGTVAILVFKKETSDNYINWFLRERIYHFTKKKVDISFNNNIAIVDKKVFIE